MPAQPLPVALQPEEVAEGVTVGQPLDGRALERQARLQVGVSHRQPQRLQRFPRGGQVVGQALAQHALGPAEDEPAAEDVRFEHLLPPAGAGEVRPVALLGPAQQRGRLAVVLLDQGVGQAAGQRVRGGDAPAAQQHE